MSKYKLWAICLRWVVMIIPVLLSIVFEWLFDKSEELLCWLSMKLPDPKKD